LWLVKDSEGVVDRADVRSRAGSLLMRETHILSGLCVLLERLKHGAELAVAIGRAGGGGLLNHVDERLHPLPLAEALKIDAALFLYRLRLGGIAGSSVRSRS
jgi:hypothetical protein